MKEKFLIFRIEVGEVFQLLSWLSDEWGWGRSQASGLSGLIPIVIMDDVVRDFLFGSLILVK